MFSYGVWRNYLKLRRVVNFTWRENNGAVRHVRALVHCNITLTLMLWLWLRQVCHDLLYDAYSNDGTTVSFDPLRIEV